MNGGTHVSAYKHSRFRYARIRFFGFFRALAMRLACATWTVHETGLADLDQRLARGEKLIVVLWHGKYITLLPLLRNRNASVVTSLSARGDVIEDLLRRFGFTGVQIPNHGKEHSLEILRKHLARGRSAVIAVDGPLGPNHQVHRGAVQLASELGRMIVPISVAASRKRTLTGRWDKLELPRLFSSIYLVVGEPVCIPSTIDAKALDYWMTKVHDALEYVDGQAIARLG